MERPLAVELIIEVTLSLDDEENFVWMDEYAAIVLRRQKVGTELIL